MYPVGVNITFKMTEIGEIMSLGGKTSVMESLLNQCILEWRLVTPQVVESLGHQIHCLVYWILSSGILLSLVLVVVLGIDFFLKLFSKLGGEC